MRLIDCVGYMVEGATGHMEEDMERMVKTPWFQEEIPFTQAAEIGTRRVIQEHSTIGIVVTTDGSFGELPRAAYRSAEEQTIQELKAAWQTFCCAGQHDKTLWRGSKRNVCRAGKNISSKSNSS